jgi:tetratricopeptide (TPR) repeat protein
MIRIQIPTFQRTFTLVRSKTPLCMKVLLGTFSLLFVSSLAFSQQVSLTASPEPAALYARANESLTVGNTKHATDIFEQVIEFYESHGRTKEVPESYLGMALAFAFSGHYAESIRFHKKALRAHHRYRCSESDDAIRMNLGFAYQLAGRDRKAKRFLQG